MAGALSVNHGTVAANVASTTMALTLAGAVVAGGRVYVFIAWAGAPTLLSLSGGGLTWVVDGQSQSGGFNVGIASAPAPAGLAASTVVTATFSASATHGLMSAASFTGIPDAAPTSVEKAGNLSGVATAKWIVQGITPPKNAAVAVFASFIDNTGNNTGDALSEMTEIHDFADASFFGALVTGYALPIWNRVVRGSGDWSVITGSVSNNSVVVVRADNSAAVVDVEKAANRYVLMKAR